ncbi:MAG: CHASE domain-containing protein [Rhodoferax sp.]|nr:CHASE domain-containing protein [Rhodoferax sp.]
MKQSFNPIRLFAEILLVVALAEALVMLALPILAPGLSGVAKGLVDVALLILFSGPTVYWRCMSATRRQVGSSDGVHSSANNHADFSLRAAIAMVAAAQFIGLIATAAFVFWLKQNLDAEAQALFDRGAERVQAEVKRRFGEPINGLKGARGTYAASRNVGRQEFRAFVESHDLATDFPGIRAFGFVARVPRADLASFVAAERVDNAPEFEVGTQGEADDLFIVKFIEPIADNRAALGLDLGQEAVHREAAERAMNTGQPALTGKAALLQNGKAMTGMLYFLPVYRQGVDPVSVKQHQAALVGLLYVPMVADDLFFGVAGVADSTLRVELFDADTSQTNALLYDSDGGAVALASADAGVGRPLPAFEQTYPLSVGGRNLSLRLSSTAVFDASQDRSILALAGVGGTLASMLAALTVWLLAVGRLRAQRQAQRMTADLDRLARVVQHTNNAVTIADAQMRITWINEGFTRLTGYSQEEATGKTPGELLASDNVDPQTIQLLMSARAKGKPCRVEVLNRAKDGREYWVDTEVQPTRDAQGMLIGFMEIGSDITLQKETQKKLEAALRASSAMLGTVEMHTIVSVSDRHGAILEVNEAFCDSSGYSREELIGQDHRIISSGQQTPQFWADMWAVISTGASWRGDICNRAKDGTLYWVDSMIAPFIGDDGLVEKYVSMRTDITARKRDQQALAEMSDRMTLAIEGGSDGLWDWLDINDNLQWWSPSYYALLGYTPQELPASVASFKNILHPDHVDLYSLASADAIAGVRPYDEEHLLLTKHQGYRWFRSRAKVYRNAQGTAVRMAGSSQDVHDRRLAEEQLKVMISRAEQASLAKSQFVANMSHEIRTPMNAILGMLKLLQNTDLTVRQMDYASKTEGAARSLLGLLNDILDFSKVEAGKMTLDPRPFKVERLMRDLSVILSANVGSKNIEVLFDVDPALPKCLLGDDMRLQQVLINLGGNAIKFTSAGAAVLSLRVVERDAHSVLVEFAMKDSGIGIAPENQAHIFSGFSQAEASTTRSYGGTGLGLAISSRMVGLLGGTLAVDSVLGEGSTFHFQIRFPLAEMQDQPAPGAATAPVPGNLHVLIVDDNSVARDVLGHTIEPLGWTVEAAASADLAMAAVRERAVAAKPPFDAIFMDFQMPGMDGWEASQRIRKMAGGDAVPIIVMVTAHGREVLSERSAAEHALINGFLIKPVTTSMLLDTVMDTKSAVAAAAQGRNPTAVQAAVKPKRLLGMRLLVVEDNKINQMVAKGLLGQEGAAVTLADNGQLGVDAVAEAQTPFDVVLMDVQMPVMDGYAATRVIRQELGLTALPIIAMTANAMASDRAACLEAGMNDHVGKPFDLDHLVATLLRYAGKAEAAQTVP